jgi:aryl-alcohol dehydrogenase-like predicted oxidoreductase
MRPKSIWEFMKRATGIGRPDKLYDRARQELEKELDIIEVIKKIRKIEIALKFILKSHHLKFLPIIGPSVIS